MPLSTINSNLHVNGGISCDTFNPPSGSINDDAIEAGANIEASKVCHRVYRGYAQLAGTATVTATAGLHIAETAGTVIGFHVYCTTHPTTTDTITAMLQKSTGAGAFANALTGVVTLDSSSVDRTVYSGTLSGTSYVAGDIFQVVVTATGTSGQGFVCELVVEENGV